jgi:hypothetical protein
MKKYIVAPAMLALTLLGATSANAADFAPIGEEEVVTLTVPQTLNECASLPTDIVGVDDIYVDYNGEAVLAATYDIVEDSDGFTVTAVLQNKYYSLSNPLAPGRSTSATFLIPRCAVVEVPTTEPVILDPIVVVAPPTSSIPVLPTNPIIPAPSETTIDPTQPVVGEPVVVVPETPNSNIPVLTPNPRIPAPVEPSQNATDVTAPSEPVVAVQSAVVTPEVSESVAAVQSTTELAETGVKETVGVLAVVILFAGIGLVILNRKTLFKN